MAFINKYGYGGLLFLLLAAWLVHFIYPVTYSVTINRVKAIQKEKIAKGRTQYERIRLTATAFELAYDKADGELNMNGRMYDVVSIQKSKDIVYCTVLNDPEETLLHEQLVKHIGHERSGKTQKQAVYWWPVAFANHHIIHYTPIAKIKCTVTLINTAVELSGFNGKLIQPPDHKVGQPLPPDHYITKTA